MLRLELPGNPRYQPPELQPIFGHDHLVKAQVEVEIATLETLAERGIIPVDTWKLFTPEVREQLLSTITTTMVDDIEKKVTKHDVRALVHVMKSMMPEPLHRYVHVPLTSYDVIDSARALQYTRAHHTVLIPLLKKFIEVLVKKVEDTADEIQIGRTHGQHALPITVGFWFAEILDRVATGAHLLNEKSTNIVGKISGAVGAHNAQVGLGICADGVEFEREVLTKLGLNAAPISTQIVPPEPLAEYLFTAVLISGALAKLGRDIRNLMRTEIGELSEPFEKGQVGSSTMAQKRNPINAENTEGTFLKSKSEFGKVLDCLVTEHQRDLVGSTVMRDFPIIIVNLVLQLKTLLRPDKQGVSFLERLHVDRGRCRENFSKEGSLILSEPLYIALQLYGYSGDAHKLVNEVIVDRARGLPSSEFSSVVQSALEEAGQVSVWEAIPRELRELFDNPDLYTGVAEKKAREVCDDARHILEQFS